MTYQLLYNICFYGVAGSIMPLIIFNKDLDKYPRLFTGLDFVFLFSFSGMWYLQEYGHKSKKPIQRITIYEDNSRDTFNLTN